MHGGPELEPTGYILLFEIFGADSMPETVVHFQIRMPPKIHETLASWAKEDKASLNGLIVGLLERAIDDHSKEDEKPEDEKADTPAKS